MDIPVILTLGVEIPAYCATQTGQNLAAYRFRRRAVMHVSTLTGVGNQGRRAVMHVFTAINGGNDRFANGMDY